MPRGSVLPEWPAKKKQKDTRAAVPLCETSLSKAFVNFRSTGMSHQGKIMKALLIYFPSMSARKKRLVKNKRWSAKVTKHSNALDLEPKVFRSRSPHKIALSLKRSAERSKRRKAKPYQSAMSMLNFYINRAGKNLPESRKQTLERAKDELRDVFDRD